jgi:protein-L-isoaspartate(D-aspartate) O-methyltransferase
LKPQTEQRHTACILYTSPPHRSQSTFSYSLRQAVWIGVIGRGGRLGGSDEVGSDMRELSHMDDMAAARGVMVDEQLARRGIKDARVLAAMRRVPRELFVPAESRGFAYADRALPIGEGQTISQPLIVAAMTEALQLQPGDRVLEVGTGSGYQAAILGELASQVTTVERRADLAEAARTRLASLGYTNVAVVVGDGSQGWKANAPYDAVLVAAGSPSIPASLTTQLADGGRLVIPIGPRDHQVLTLVRRMGERLQRSDMDGCVFVPLVGQEGWDESDM